MFTGPERVGIRSITRTLNSYGTKPRNSKLWSESTVRGILSNVVYDQCVKIGERKVVRTVENGVLTTTRPRTSDYTIVSGRHPRLIDHDVFAEAQSYLGCGSPKPAGSSIIKIRLPESLSVMSAKENDSPAAFRNRQSCAL